MKRTEFMWWSLTVYAWWSNNVKSNRWKELIACGTNIKDRLFFVLFFTQMRCSLSVCRGEYTVCPCTCGSIFQPHLLSLGVCYTVYCVPSFTHRHEGKGRASAGVFHPVSASPWCNTVVLRPRKNQDSNSFTQRQDSPPWLNWAPLMSLWCHFDSCVWWC